MSIFPQGLQSAGSSRWLVILQQGPLGFAQYGLSPAAAAELVADQLQHQLAVRQGCPRSSCIGAVLENNQAGKLLGWPRTGSG